MIQKTLHRRRFATKNLKLEKKTLALKWIVYDIGLSARKKKSMGLFVIL